MKNNDVKPNVKSNAKPDTNSDAKPTAKPYVKSDAKPAGKSDAKPYVKRDAKPYTKGEAKPYNKGESKPYSRDESKPYNKGESRPYSRDESKPYNKTDVKRPARPAVHAAAPKDQTPKAPKHKTSGAMLAHGVGRRKSSVARVWIKRGSGKISINAKEHAVYFDTDVTRNIAAFAFYSYPNYGHYDLDVNVYGGGLCSQADAIKLGTARALVEINPEIRPILRQHGLLTVDSRLKERKKYGQKAARRKFQFVKR